MNENLCAPKNSCHEAQPVSSAVHIVLGHRLRAVPERHKRNGEQENWNLWNGRAFVAWVARAKGIVSRVI